MAKNPAPDALRALAEELGDVMPPKWHALVAVLRFWLGLFQALGALGGVLLGIAVGITLADNLGLGTVGRIACYCAVALPLSVGSTATARALRRIIARRAARAIEVSVRGAIGGASTSMGVPLEMTHHTGD